MAFPNGYSYRRKITIDHTKTANLTFGTRAIDFNPTNSQRLQIADANQTGLDLSTDFTIEAWVRIDQLPSTAGNTFSIVTKYESGGNNRSYQFFINTSNEISVQFNSDGGSGSGSVTTIKATETISPADIGRWIHLAVAVDISVPTASFYKNGVALTTSVTTANATSIYNGAAAFGIGAREATQSTSTWDSFFDGQIKDVRVWGDIRSSSEIANNYQGYLSISPGTDNLIENWKMDNYNSESTNNNLAGAGDSFTSPTATLLEHTNFRMLFRGTYAWLADTSNGGKVTSSSGNDIRFEDFGGSKFDHDIVSYDNTTGAIEAWVEIPSVGFGTDRDIYVYYGKSGASAEENPSGLFSSSLKARYEFNASDLTSDWTANNHDLTDISDPAATTGKIGGGVQLDGNDAYSIVDNANLKPTTAFYISLWLKTSSTGSFKTVAQSYSQNTNLAGWALKITNGNVLRFRTGRNTGTSQGTNWQQVDGTTNVCDGNWHHVVALWNGQGLILFLDGALEAVTTWANAPGYAATNYVRIGCANETGSNIEIYTGDLDEVRIAVETINHELVIAQYHSQNDPSTFYSLDDEESSGISPSASISPSTSVSPSPSAGYTLYSRGAIDFENNDNDLDTLYTEQDIEDISEADDVRVGISGTDGYLIHQFKVFITDDENSCDVQWEGQSSLAPSTPLRPVFMVIFNRSTEQWQFLNVNSTASADTDFTLSAHISDLSDYKDESGVIAIRVAQDIRNV